MPDPESTRWTLIRAAAEGDAVARSDFACRYEPLVRAYLGARWRHSPLRREIDDAAQEVFVDCLKEGGALQRVEDDRPGGFRAFLFGVIRNVARRAEARWLRRERQPDSRLHLSEIQSREEALSHVFDRAWAVGILTEALERQEERARTKGEHALRRIELLRLRFHEGMPIRDIAKAWNEDANALHGHFLKAREEFRRALREVVREVHGGSVSDVDAECARLAEHF